MLMLHRRLGQLNNLHLVLVVLLVFGFLVEVKVLYHKHQRNMRFTDYKQRVNDLSFDMNAVARIANSTSEIIRRLQASLKSKRLVPKVTPS